ncbi:DNA-binding response regulator [Anaerocolumna cellulosilytica]|uniref:Stage 0 sporulation protein A homolog n=1 Tax=Anaerocolumna cellulosilytica TaxID=433286 RepID=A0A6S6RBA8_9FIRM|nr:response regulator transcription factor [Anaerocolumna cellulosilytica]MBB5197497.1 DNA-binding response OmpR family regulator [Anaerocolumna cellulosilytica]BCJ96522.1 DNA-binding response regulator [Anaerocolumna cellulosilytica]
MSKKILLVDDEKGIVTMMKYYFEMSGYSVYTACSGNEALQKVAHNPDIILLDINMPDIDGLTVCQHIREHISCPILFLTARIATSDKINGFRAGADDYIVKPFDLDELGARVAAHLRRENRRQEQSVVRFFGDMVIDYSKRQVTIKESIISLSKKEFDIVELLSMNAGQVFDRERIYDLVWGLDGDGNSGTIMEHIRKTRAKFATLSLHSYIETVWGVGYKWNG